MQPSDVLSSYQVSKWLPPLAHVGEKKGEKQDDEKQTLTQTPSAPRHLASELLSSGARPLYFETPGTPLGDKASPITKRFPLFVAVSICLSLRSAHATPR